MINVLVHKLASNKLANLAYDFDLVSGLKIKLDLFYFSSNQTVKTQTEYKCYLKIQK